MLSKLYFSDGPMQLHLIVAAERNIFFCCLCVKCDFLKLRFSKELNSLSMFNKLKQVRRSERKTI